MEKPRVNMFDPAVFSIRIDGTLSESWSEYLPAQSISAQVEKGGRCSTTLITEPVDQAALIGILNHLNGLALPVASVECLPASDDNQPLEKNDMERRDP